jgi:hypothetical protein
MYVFSNNSTYSIIAVQLMEYFFSHRVFTEWMTSMERITFVQWEVDVMIVMQVKPAIQNLSIILRRNILHSDGWATQMF